MYHCSSKRHSFTVDDAEADKLKGVCPTDGMGLADEKGLGWAYNDSLREKPLQPDSVQAKAVAKAKGPATEEGSAGLAAKVVPPKPPAPPLASTPMVAPVSPKPATPPVTVQPPITTKPPEVK